MTNSKGFGQDDFYLLKIDNFGNILWDFVYGGENDDTLKGYIVAGMTLSFDSLGSDIIILKFDQQGKI
jgi:hypothetical protein